MSHEMRIYGPPGTGKTRKLAQEIVPRLADKYGSEKVMLTSFTRAAAEELSQRIVGAGNIGTLHSICYQALEKPLLTDNYIKDWNDNYLAYAFNGADPTGKECFAEYQIYRNKLIPRDKWRPHITKFASVWETWKRETNLSDFIDLVEDAGELLSPPGSPSAIVIDEAQDFTRLEIGVLRRWATQIRELWVVGDEDQTLYSFSGADPRNMLFPVLPPEQKIILNRSWRIPRAVHTVAQQIIRRVTVREPKDYSPKDVEGSCIDGSGHFNNPDWAIEKALDLPGTSMFLVSCNYMLQGIVKQLRDQGIPFSNPWKPDEASWNPLNTLGCESIKSFLSFNDDDDFWSTARFLDWATHLKVGEEGLIRKQGKTGIKQLTELLEEDPDTPGLHTCADYIRDILSPIAVERALNRDTEWLVTNTNKAKSKVMEYPLRVIRKHGEDKLLEQTKIQVGTIHCSPPDEPILTTNGYIPISKLDLNKHTLASYTHKTNYLSWGTDNRQKGYPFSVSKREYIGKLITITTEKSTTRITPNHKLRVKFTKNFWGKWVVYLMRRGNWWRIGVCVSGHLPYRRRRNGGIIATEQADSIWILKVYNSKEEALFAGASFQSSAGIIGLTFEASRKHRVLTSRKMLHAIHESCSIESTRRATRLLCSMGMNPKEPLWTRSCVEHKNGSKPHSCKRSMRGMFEIKAMNFLSGYMEMLIPRKSFVEKLKGQPKSWQPLFFIGYSSTNDYSGFVYGLDVMPYHFYISGGAVVHNSVKGAEADNVFLFPDISAASGREGETKEGYENLCRLFYVGVTRAKENLILMPPSTKSYFSI